MKTEIETTKKIMNLLLECVKDKNLTRAIVFSSLYKIALAKMREGMKCQVIISKLDDGTLNYLMHERFKLPNLPHTEKGGQSIETSVINYINSQFDPTMNWKDAEYVAKKWKGAFALKGITSVADAKKAVDIGATAIMISNHGGRQLDASMSPFDVLADIVDAVGDKIDVILDGGVRRGTHVLKALALGAKACSFGKAYLYALSAGGQAGVEAVLKIMHDEIKRGMTLMGCRNIKELTKDSLIFRKR